jgi:hypothetical protein
MILECLRSARIEASPSLPEGTEIAPDIAEVIYKNRGDLYLKPASPAPASAARETDEPVAGLVDALKDAYHKAVKEEAEHIAAKSRSADFFSGRRNGISSMLSLVLNYPSLPNPLTGEGEND